MESTKKRQLPFIVAISSLMLGLFASVPLGKTPAVEAAEPTVLRVITRPSLHTFYDSKNGPDGMEFQLIQSFAHKHGLPLELIVTDDSDAIYSALDNGLADIALLGQPLSIVRQGNYPQSTPYRDVTSLLLHKSGTSKPASLADLSGKTVFVRDTEQNRIKYRHLKAYYGDMEWQFTDEPIDSLLAKVSKGIIDYTITDSLTFALKHPLYPNVQAGLDLHDPEPVSLLYSSRISDTLRQRIDHYIEASLQDGSLALLMERFYGHATDLDNNHYRSFSLLMRNRLPAYEQAIKTVAHEQGMDWRLLAAIAYQESHWDPEARSKTGVRGFMMLTYDTATELGVEDRLDTLQSLRGGARYFQKILKDLPATIQEPDRTWMALAAYNVGTGHLLDAMELTRQQDGNADSWLDVKKHLPLLSKKEWHSKTRFGYARGYEPVNFVQNIRRYYDILAWRYPMQYFEKSSAESQLIVKTLDQVIQEQRKPVTLPEEDRLRISALFF